MKQAYDWLDLFGRPNEYKEANQSDQANGPIARQVQCAATTPCRGLSLSR
jgi:hypothetical protein